MQPMEEDDLREGGSVGVVLLLPLLGTIVVALLLLLNFLIRELVFRLLT